MKKFKLNHFTNSLKLFANNSQGAYGVATVILSLPLFMIVSFTIDMTGTLKDKSQLERVLDSAAYTITAENSQFRVKSFQAQLPQCNEKYDDLDYSQMNNKTKECQYHIILADIEKRTGLQGLVNPNERNKTMIEATARVFFGSNELIARSDSDRITKNIRSQCKKETNNIYPDASGIICVVAGDITPKGLQGIASRIDGNYIDSKNQSSIGANGVATRADLIPPPLDIVVAVDISAPFIDKTNKGYYRNDAMGTLRDLYNKQKQAMNLVADFIGKLETHMFQQGKNPNNRLSYLAFSGGGQETPLQTQPTLAGVSGTLRKNVLPYILRGQHGRYISPGDLKFNFHNDSFFEKLYFPFYRGSGVQGQSYNTNTGACKSDLSWGCTWIIDQRAFQTVNGQNFSDTSLSINDRETIFTQYLKVRFTQHNDLSYQSGAVGSQGGKDCENQYSGQSQTQSLQLTAQQIGINCFNAEVNLDDYWSNGNKPEYGVSGVFVGIDDFIDSRRTVDEIAKFDGTARDWKLHRTANYPDVILPINIDGSDKYPHKPGNTIQDKEILDTNYTTGDELLYDYYSFTPTRNINKELVPRNGTYTHPYADIDYVNTRAVLTSQWETRDSYNKNKSNSLQAQFSQVVPSGVSFPSSGMLLGANRMMDVNTATQGREKTQRVLVVIMSERNERQDLLMMDNLVKAGMCDKIRERFKNNGQDFDGQIYIVNIDFLRYVNQGGTISIPANQNYKPAYSDKRNESITQCVKNDGEYLTKAYYNTLDSDLDRLVSKIMDKNASLGGTNRAISVRNLPMYE